MLSDILTRAALVTGATGGIGKTLVTALTASKQWTNIIAVSRQASGDTALQQLAARDHRVLLMNADVTNEAQLERLAEKLTQCDVSLGLLCNTVGLLHNEQIKPEKHLKACRKDAFLESLTVNTVAPMLLARYLSPLFPRSDRALLVNLSARVGSITDNRLGGWYAYRCSKAALNMLTRTLSIELPRRHRGLVTLSYHPGTVDSELSRPFQSNVPADRLFSPDTAVKHLLQLLESVTEQSNGRFYAWDGSEIPW